MGKPESDERRTFDPARFLLLGRWQAASRRVESRSRTDDISDPTTRLGSCVIRG